MVQWSVKLLHSSLPHWQAYLVEQQHRRGPILGLAEGQEIEWPQPDGQMMKVKIEKVVYQPEREGDYL